MITVLWAADKTHGLLTDDTGNQALVTGGKTIFIGVDKSGKACFRDIHDVAYVPCQSQTYTDNMLQFDSLEELNEMIKIRHQVLFSSSGAI